MQGYSLQKVAEHATAHCGVKNPITTVYVSRVLHDLRGVSEKFSPSALFSIEEMRCVAEFAAEHYHKHSDVNVLDWLKDLERTVPIFYEEKQIVKTKNRAAVKDNEPTKAYLRKLEKKMVVLEELVRKTLDFSTNKQITDNRDSDPRAEKVEKTITKFVECEPISRNSVLGVLQKRFEERNGLKVFLIGEQTFLQWLRSENWLDTFLAEMQGFLDELHDRLNSLPVRSGGGSQGELGL